MKNYRRDNPLFSLCGLSCGLCPMHLGGYCPGCGGGEGHQPCAVIRCSRERGDMQYCYECGQFPCQRYERLTAFDSFLSHAHMVQDLTRAREMGPDAFALEQNEKVLILKELLARYNDGRKKSFFCTAAALLDLKSLRLVMAELEKETNRSMPMKERAALAAGLFLAQAQKQGVSLRLRKKKKEK